MTAIAAATPTRQAGMVAQTGQLTMRLIVQRLRNPAITLPNLFISVFFLLVYDGALGGSEAISGVTGGNYMNFILPVAILTSSLAGAASGLILVEDLESGYFRRLMSMPVSRWAVVAAAMLVGALQVVVQTIVIIVLGVLLGADPATGFAGWLFIIALAFFWGLAFAGYSVAMGLKTRNAQATQASTLLAFPLLFLTTTFLPMEFLKDWMQVAATINPTTYVLEAMRAALIDGWAWATIAWGFVAGIAVSGLTLMWALSVARSAIQRG